MENLTDVRVLLPKGQRVTWGAESGRVVADVGFEHVWVERDDGADCFALRALLVSAGRIVDGAKVTHPFRHETGVLICQFDRSDGVRMGVVELGGYRTDNFPMSELSAA